MHNLLKYLNTNNNNHRLLFEHATQLHAQFITNNIPSNSSSSSSSSSSSLSSIVFNSLLILYAKCGHINQTILLFSSAAHDSTFRNIFAWTTLISLLSRSHRPFQALLFFNQMRSSSGLYPNPYTFSAVLSASAHTLIPLHGQQLHSLISKHGFHSDLFVASALLDMYAKCGLMCSAERLFDEMPRRNLVSWNSLIVGFSHNRLYDLSFGAFRDILRQHSNINPDQVTFSSVLSSCANVGASEFGKQVHGVAIKHGLITVPYVLNSLMGMYCKLGLFDDAATLFQTVENKDVVAWNVMIMGSSHNHDFDQACHYFCAMKRKGISPDEASYSSILHAFAGFATLNQGTSVHGQIIKSGFTKNAWVSSSLITMYAKCGCLGDALCVFEGVERQNSVCWTAMIAAYQQHGRANQVKQLFEEMLGEGINPDYVTYVCIISACSHTGCVDEGYKYFNSMTKVHGMSPGNEHYACMVDLLGRAGRLDEAKNFVKSMPMKPDPTVWGALLGACASYGNLEMGREVAERLFQLEPDNPGNYVMLSNMYAHHGKLKEANEVRRLMRVKGIRKEPGCSWVDFRNSTFVFTAHDKSHPWTDKIYETLRNLKDLVNKKGYEAEIQFAVNGSEEYKEQSLWYHSEKLALAFALMALPSGQPILIKKNLRTCGDCHAVMKFASEIYKRDIIVRDINRFHHFTNGFCSCGDYW